jgi:SAM-dependent methyltransferase
LTSLPDTARPPRWLDASAARLFLCGFAALFWELVLIRWLGASIRIVAYFSNLVLISAFFGLGTGALMTRFSWRLERLIAPLVAVAAMLGVGLGRLWYPNPSQADELIWLGAPRGLPSLTTGMIRIASTSLVLLVVYCATALVFVAFGQLMGRLFKTRPPLVAYSLEVGGSLAGIALMALLSHWQTSPTVWFLLGFALIVVLLPPRGLDTALAVLLGVLVVLGTRPAVRGYVWSPYYRIAVEPITSVVDPRTKAVAELPAPVGYALTVNSDYHQMMLDLRPRSPDLPLLAGWRRLYDGPYREGEALPPGPVLVVGAGTGNDVSAALRDTDRRVTAVEIDPAISELGRKLHPERPYQNPRVTLVTDDARSFFHRTREKYALVVFGFLDSHRLLSAFSSVRLDNFIYTREAMEETRRLLVPGGRVAVSFVSSRPWVHARMLRLLDEAFDEPTATEADTSGYASGLLYLNGLRRDGKHGAVTIARAASEFTAPTDDWPFLYLRGRAIPSHNVAFLVVAILLGASALLLLPRGERRIRLPYLFLGAAFFLIETSNVVRMSLLYGSTWWVNTLVFAGILVLVLLSNLTAATWKVPVGLCLSLIGGGILLAAWIPPETLLALSPLPRAVAAIGLLLGPVYFGGLIFARLITGEPRLFEAYGSNVLGAVLGGAAEYLSVVFGFRFLFAIALAFYLVVFLLLRREVRVGTWSPG